MCGRFTATFEFREIKVRWNLQHDLPVFAPRYNIAPSQDVPVIVRRAEGNQIMPMHWGLVPSWAKDPSIGQRMINARAETLAEKPSFKRLIGTHRCLVPADGFYEWRREGKRKVPVWVLLKNKEPFGFAGLWDLWRQPEGAELYSFTIITTDANELLRNIHDRMPVMLDSLAGEQWLDPTFTSFRTLSFLLRPFPSERMEAHDVSTLVNSPANDTEECIEPA
jgi:putative SOS response-associated peptidase YedK